MSSGAPALVALIGQLSTRSQAFRTRWAAHDVKRTGRVPRSSGSP
nr:hypothetical protein [Saccharothrix longispora]